MFTLDVATDKMEKFDGLLNRENIVYRVVGKNEDGTFTTVKFTKQEKLEKAQEVLKNI